MQVYIRTPAFFISNTLTVILTAVIVPQKQQTQTDLFALKVRLAPECYLLLLSYRADKRNDSPQRQSPSRSEFTVTAT